MYHGRRTKNFSTELRNETDGVLTWISNKSGHDRPGSFDFLETLPWLYQPTITHAAGSLKEKFDGVEEFLRHASLDDESIDSLAEFRKWNELLDLLKPEGVGALGLKWNPNPDALRELDLGSVVETRSGRKLDKTSLIESC